MCRSRRLLGPLSIVIPMALELKNPGLAALILWLAVFGAPKKG